jgi:hypothetical protein
MEYSLEMEKEPRGLRFACDASAEIALESSPTTVAPARVTQLSFQGCFLKTSTSFEVQRQVLLKIYDSGELFECKASVHYVQPSGIGLLFREIKPHFRCVLQNWMLRALDNQLEAPTNPD